MLETRRCMVSARSRGDSRRKLARSSAFLLSMMDGIRILYHTSRLYHQIQPLPRGGPTVKPVVSTAKRPVAREAGNGRNDNPVFYICPSPPSLPPRENRTRANPAFLRDDAGLACAWRCEGV